MTAHGILRRLRLTEGDLEAIKASVREAEMSTSGEIALAAIAESSDYSFRELLASVVLGAITFTVLLPFHGAIVTFLDRAIWHLPSWYITAFYGIAFFAVIGVSFLFANLPVIDRLVVPRADRSRAVYERALRHFTESGVYATKERTGILVFVSLMEREVRIVADTGISAHIAQNEWDSIARGLALGIKAGKSGEAIVSAVNRCGRLLTDNFPAHRENPNELEDGLVLLEARR